MQLRHDRPGFALHKSEKRQNLDGGEQDGSFDQRSEAARRRGERDGPIDGQAEGEDHEIRARDGEIDGAELSPPFVVKLSFQTQ